MKICHRLLLMFSLIIGTLSLPAAQTTKTNSCSVQQTKLTVNTVRVIDIKATRASCSFTVQGSPVNEKGVCFSEGHSPTIRGKKSMTPGIFTNNGMSILSGLKPATTYYVRAYAKSGSEVFYGNELIFKTLTMGDEKKPATTAPMKEPKP